ncbi:MAG: PASTA domain-containing protein [Acidobacteriaceae bacterium]
MTSLFRTLSLLLLLVCVALASAILTMKLVIHSAEVTIPNLKGKTLSQAHDDAAALHLDIRIANHLYSPTIPAGRVLNQSPEPGTTVRTGWHMQITESLGPQTVNIPTLTGEPSNIAIQQLRQSGLQLGSLAYLPSQTAPSGTVLAQSPQANAQGVASPRVDLLIATPPAPAPAQAIVMPSLKGQTLSSARQILTQAGLKLTSVKKIYPAIRPIGSIASTAPPQQPILPGSVIAQTPPSGYRVQPGDSVTLTVAK